MQMRFGQGDYRYELVEGWGKLPAGWSFAEVAAVAVDSHDRVYAFHRGTHPVIVFSREGDVLGSWGDDWLKEAHGLFIDREDNLFLVDRGAHAIEKCTVRGEPVLTFGVRGNPAPQFCNLPMNMPQGAAAAPSGELYVADGKRNNAVHKYAADGRYLFSWGTEGSGPGEFREPHGIWVRSDGVVMVADRCNDRIQFFDPDGVWLAEWRGDAVHHPDHIYVDNDGVVFVTEIDFNRVSILSPDGELLSRWGVGPGPDGGRSVGSAAPGLFRGPHGIWTDSHGDLYVSEVLTGRRIQKFARI
jgi:DNA-binding beta-propeller fold protein YncE